MEVDSSVIKKSRSRYSLGFYLFLFVAIIEFIYIYLTHDLTRVVSMSPYYFGDSGNRLVTAHGSWISSQTDLAFPLSTVNIECWKDFGYCWVVDATLMDINGYYLSSGSNLHEIQYWTDDFIQTKPDSPAAGCVEEFYRLDRRSKTATYTRRTINTSGSMCEGISEEPITATLSDGYKRLDTYHKNR